MFFVIFSSIFLLKNAECLNWSELDLPDEHVVFFFNNNPSLVSLCREEKSQCPYWTKIENLPPFEKNCWGYEENCENNGSLNECPEDSRGWTNSKENQRREFWRTGDFGYIKEKRQELKELCSSEDRSASLECVDHLRFCRAKNIFIDFRHAENSKNDDRYRENILQNGDIGARCRIDRNELIKQSDQKSPLQSWAAELEFFTEILPNQTYQCDLFIDKPTIFIKLDSGYNMYHHFCDFINLYLSLHMNNTFTKDIQIILWDTSRNEYWSFFSSTWDAFTSHRLIHIKEFQGKRVCFNQVIFSFLARMFYGSLRKFSFLIEKKSFDWIFFLCTSRFLLQYATHSRLCENESLSFVSTVSHSSTSNSTTRPA